MCRVFYFVTFHFGVTFACNQKRATMRNFIPAIMGLMLLTFSSCVKEGPPGPPGPPGEELVSTVYDVTVNFTKQNDYSVLFDFTPAIYTSDVVLTYIQWDTDQGRPIWRLIPQVISFSNGNLQYNYDFTNTDIRLFLEAEFDLDTLGPEWTSNQVFRIVVVPGVFGGKMDYSNYELVAEQLGLNNQTIPMKVLE